MTTFRSTSESPLAAAALGVCRGGVLFLAIIVGNAADARADAAMPEPSRQIQARGNAATYVELRPPAAVTRTAWTFRITRPPRHGYLRALSRNPVADNFGMVYTPQPEFLGADEFSYVAVAARPPDGPETTIRIHVSTDIDTPANAAPVRFAPPTAGSGPAVAQAPVTVVTACAGAHFSFLDWQRTLVGWWRAEKGAEDASGNGRHGHFVGSAGTVDDGVFGRAFRFLGDNDALRGDNDPAFAFTPEDSFSIAAWVKPRRLDRQQGILIRGDNHGRYSLAFAPGLGWRFLIADRDGPHYVHAKPSRPVGEWVHLLGVYDARAQRMTLYVDGTQAATAAVTPGNFGTAKPLIIGQGRTRGHGWQGLIDEVLVFSRALTTAEARALVDARTGILHQVFHDDAGSRTVRAFAADASGRQWQTEERTVNLSSPPRRASVEPLRPAPNAWLGSRETVLLCHATEQADETPVAAVVVLDGARRLPLQRQPDGSLGVQVTQLTDGIHRWCVRTGAADAPARVSETRRFNVDTTRPRLEMSSPTTDVWRRSDTPLELELHAGKKDDAYVFLDLRRTLIGWWRAEDAATDDAPRRNDGRLIGHATTTADGRFGQAFQLDGDGDFVEIRDDEDLNFNADADFTISVWVYAFGPLNGARGIVHKGGAHNRWTLAYTAGRWQFDLRANAQSAVVYWRDPQPHDRWVHLAAVRDSRREQLRLFVDGQRRAVASCPPLDVTSARPLRLGSFRHAGREWRGLIDDVMLFRRALAESEIQALTGGEGTRLRLAIADVGEGEVCTFTAQAADSRGNTRAVQRRIRVDRPDTPPTVTLVAPLGPRRSERTTHTFTVAAQATDEAIRLTRAELLMGSTGDRLRTVDTRQLDRSAARIRFTVTAISRGPHVWNCRVYDARGYSAIAPIGQRLVIGPTRFVIAPDGDDSHAGSIEAPYRTIRRFADSALPGDTGMVRAGTYRETVVFAHSGLPDAPITLRAYPGEHPIISGADPVFGWRPRADGLLVTALPWDLGPGKNQLFAAGQALMAARWPNADSVMQPTFAPIRKGIVKHGRATIYGPPPAAAAGDWTGGFVHAIWAPRYHAVTGTITHHTAQRLVVDLHTATHGDINRRGAFYVFGVPAAIDTPGEWAVDRRTGQLLLQPPAAKADGPPDIEAKHRQLALDLRGRAWIQVTGLHLFAATAITDARSHHIVLDNIHARYVSHYSLIDAGNMGDGAKGIRDSGIVLDGHDNVLRNSEIAGSAGNGVTLLGHHHTVADCRIHDVNNVVTEAAAIHTGGRRSDGHRIVRNVLYNAGRCLLVHTRAQGLSIAHNELFGARFSGESSDLGAIYCIRTDGRGTEIANNYIHDTHSVGIYFDAFSSNMTARDNRIEGTAPCVALLVNDGCADIRVLDNTVSGQVSIAATAVNIVRRGATSEPPDATPPPTRRRAGTGVAASPSRRPWIIGLTLLVLTVAGAGLWRCRGKRH